MTLQPVRAQSTASGVFRIGPRDRAMQQWVTRQLLQKAPGWSQIWQRSLAMGGSLVPFLDQGLRDQNPHRRLVFIGAYSLATRRGDVLFLGRSIRSQKKQDRFLCLFAHALGPRQIGDATALLKKAAGGTDLERIAACAAAARCLDRPQAPAAYAGSDAIGVLAAAMFYRPDRRVAWLRQRLKSLGQEAFEHLVWRAYFLGEPSLDVVESDRQQLAIDVLRKSDGAPAVADEAAYYVARSPQAAAVLTPAELARLPLRQRLLLAHAANLRHHLLRQDPVLRTEPEVLQRRWVRMQVSFGSLDRIRAALPGWLRLKAFEDKEHRTALGMALTARLLRLSSAEAKRAQIDLTAVGDAEVSAWRAIAVSETHASPPPGDAERERLARLLGAGQLTRAQVAAQLERAAWRDGSHPARTGLDLYRQLLGELLIDGSRIGATTFAKAPRRPYLADGLRREEPLFQVAAELFKFVQRAEPWSMPEYRFAN